MLSLNKKVDKQNSHSNVEQNHHDNQDRAVGLRGRERERKREKGRVSIIRTHTHSKLTHEAFIHTEYLTCQHIQMYTVIYIHPFLRQVLLPQLVVKQGIIDKKVKGNTNDIC